MAQKRLLTVPMDVQTIIVSLGTQGNMELSSMTAEEVKAADEARTKDHQRVMQEHGDFTGAVREGTWDDGQQVIEAEALNTSDLIKQLENLGFPLVDVYRSSVRKGDRNLQKVVAVFSKTAKPTDRATSQAKAHFRVHLTRNWGHVYVWYNPLRAVPNMTVNCSKGNLREGYTPPRLELVAMTTSDQSA